MTALSPRHRSWSPFNFLITVASPFDNYRRVFRLKPQCQPTDSEAFCTPKVPTSKLALDEPRTSQIAPDTIIKTRHTGKAQRNGVIESGTVSGMAAAPVHTRWRGDVFQIVPNANSSQPQRNAYNTRVDKLSICQQTAAVWLVFLLSLPNRAYIRPSTCNLPPSAHALRGVVFPF